MYLHEEDEDDYKQSLSRFESMLKTNKVYFFDSSEFEDIIYHYYDLGKINLAKKALKISLEQHPQSVDLQLIKADFLTFDSKFDEASKIIDRVLDIEPNNDDALLLKANVFSRTNQHLKAIEILEQTLDLTDNKAMVYHYIGMEYLFLEKPEDALKFFTHCIEIDPEDQTALFNVIHCYEFLDQYMEGIEFLDRYLDKNPYSDIGWHNQGRLYYEIKEYKKALRAYEFASYIDDEFMGAIFEKGKCQEKLQMYEEAIESYLETYSEEDPSAYALLRIGRCFEKLGALDKALEFYTKSTHVAPLFDKSWAAISNFYANQNKYEEALENINKALELSDHNDNYWIRYASINLQLNRKAEAEIGFQKAAEFGNIDSSNWTVWLDSLAKSEQYVAIILAVESASNYFQNNDEISIRYASAKYLSGAKELGLNLFEILLQKEKDCAITIQNVFPEIYEQQDFQELLSKWR